MNEIAIQKKIHEIRDQKVMLDYDLAELYETETKMLKRAVRRNIERFPSDFMFELNVIEWENLRCQFGTSSLQGRTRYLPFAFTEQGVAMLSSVLNSKKAIEVNISIIRTFVLIRKSGLNYAELSAKLKEIEGKFSDVYQAINYLLEKDKKQSTQKERQKIGFKV